VCAGKTPDPDKATHPVKQGHLTMETLNDRTPRNGTSGLRTWRSAAALLALTAGTCTALAQPGASPAAVRNGPAGSVQAPASEPAAEPAGVDISGEVSVDENLTVELHVRNEELSTVLQLLSLQSQRSIIAGPNVNATVTANLYGVTFYEALDAVLHTYGYGYIEQGNMIYVMTREEVEEIATEGRLPVAKIIYLNYLSSVDAAEYVSPLLSDVGEIRTNGRAEDFSVGDDNPEGADTYAGDSMMIVFDFEENVAEIEALVSQIDTRPEQVLVEATILQASLREDNAFGVDFSIIGDLDFSEFIGGPLNGINNMISGARDADGPIPSDNEGQNLSSTVGQTNGPGGLKIGIVDNDVAVFMRFLD
jgi:type II secretory pathway component GspD/PulD (secretin)